MTRSQLKRALGAAEKSERRSAIVSAAETLLHRDPAATFSVEALARCAGLAKGTVYLYFRTREEVLLALHERQLHTLFDVLARALERPRADARSVVRAGLRHHAGHPEFYPLAGSCRTMLDTKIGAEAALAFHLGLAQRLATLGARVEKLYPALRPGEGAALLVNSYALIIGLWQQADIPVVLRKAMQRPDLKVFRMNFETQLERALLDLWEAAERRGGRSTP